MKCFFVLILLFTTLPSRAEVKVCKRAAQLMFGWVDHKWIETDEVSAGMGSGNPLIDQIGDTFEAPFITEVFIVDHLGQNPEQCDGISYVDEDCVNNELQIGKYLGRFHPLNHCQKFVKTIIDKCETEERSMARVEYRKLRMLLLKSKQQSFDINLNGDEYSRMIGLKEEYDL